MVKIECVVDVPSRIGESPVWDSRTQTLLWVDIPVGIIHRFTPADGKHQQIKHGEKIGSFALRENDGLLIAGDSGLQTFDLETGARTVLHHPEPDMTMNRFNDGVTDNQGRFWVGTMNDNKDVRGTAPEPTGRFYRFDPDGTCMPWKDNIYTPNGMTFSPDGKRMYFADSFPERRTIWMCDYDTDTGTPISDPAVFFDTHAIAGRPDGACVDAEGCYWMAGVGGWQIVRITPQGVVDRIIEMPVEKPTKPIFGGPNLDVMYITSLVQGLSEADRATQPLAGGVFAITGLGVGGLDHVRFAG